MQKRALIQTGPTTGLRAGQGLQESASLFNTARIDHRRTPTSPRNFIAAPWRRRRTLWLIRIVQSVQPDEI